MAADIIIPCYNEESRLDVASFESFLAANQGFRLLFVNDGSSDRTLDILRAFEGGASGRVIVIDQQPNQGKAEAVRIGMLRSLELGQADYVGYFDADLATPLPAAQEFIQVMQARSDIELVLGSRVALLGRDIQRQPLRHYLGRLFATVASLVLALPVYDTQCGAKLFRAKPEFKALFAQRFRSRWVFDVELLARLLLLRSGAAGIYEHPLQRWLDVKGSRVKATDFIRSAGDLARIYRHYFLRRDRRRLVALIMSPVLRYAGAGGVGTLLHYLVLTLCVEVFAMRPTLGTFLGASVGAAVNYALNYHFTFASSIPHRTALPKFLTVALLGVGINSGGMWLLLHLTRWHYLPSQMLCTIVVFTVGYIANAVWTFRAAEDEPSVGS